MRFLIPRGSSRFFIAYRNGGKAGILSLSIKDKNNETPRSLSRTGRFFCQAFPA